MGLLDKLLDREPALSEDTPLPNLDAEPETPEEGAAKPKKKQSKVKGFEFGRATVDFTPEAFKEAVRVRELRKQWIFICAAIFALSSLVVSFIFVSALPVGTELESQLRINSALEGELSQYQEVNLAVEQKDATLEKLNRATNNAIDWGALLGSIEGALPSGTSMKSIGITTEGASTEKGASIIISFVADSPLGYADTLQAVQSAQGVSNVQIGGMTSSGDSYSFSATLDYDSSIRTNKFPTADQAATGGN